MARLAPAPADVLGRLGRISWPNSLAELLGRIPPRSGDELTAFQPFCPIRRVRLTISCGYGSRRKGPSRWAVRGVPARCRCRDHSRTSAQAVDQRCRPGIATGDDAAVIEQELTLDIGCVLDMSSVHCSS